MYLWRNLRPDAFAVLLRYLASRSHPGAARAPIATLPAESGPAAERPREQADAAASRG